MSRSRPVADYPVCPNFSTHIFQVKFGVELTLRIWPGDPQPDGKPTPWILYAHGGAWGFGKNQLPNAWYIPAFRPFGYHFVSLGYRKTPQVWIKDIIEDALDAYAWCTENLGSVLGREAVDVEKYVLAGESAGGYIALMLANRLSKTTTRPRAAISCYGPTDLLTGLGRGCEVLGWWPSGEFTQSEINRHIADHDPSHAVALCPEEFDLDVNVLREQWQDPSVVFNRRLRLQYETTKYLTTSGRLMKVLLRCDDDTTTSSEADARAMIFSPLYLIDEVSWHPPTYFFHGTNDFAVSTDVHLTPFIGKLLHRGIPTGLSLAEGKGHGFDNAFTDPNGPEWDHFVSPAVQFVERFAK